MKLDPVKNPLKKISRLCTFKLTLLYVKSFHAEEFSSLQSARLSDVVEGLDRLSGGKKIPHQSHPGVVPNSSASAPKETLNRRRTPAVPDPVTTARRTSFAWSRRQKRSG